MFFIFTSLPKAVGISYMGNPKVSSCSFSSSLLDSVSSSSLAFLLAFHLILSPSNLSLSIASLASLSNLSLSSHCYLDPCILPKVLKILQSTMEILFQA